MHTYAEHCTARWARNDPWWRLYAPTLNRGACTKRLNTSLYSAAIRKSEDCTKLPCIYLQIIITINISSNHNYIIIFWRIYQTTSENVQCSCWRWKLRLHHYCYCYCCDCCCSQHSLALSPGYCPPFQIPSRSARESRRGESAPTILRSEDARIPWCLSCKTHRRRAAIGWRILQKSDKNVIFIICKRNTMHNEKLQQILKSCVIIKIIKKIISIWYSYHKFKFNYLVAKKATRDLSTRTANVGSDSEAPAGRDSANFHSETQILQNPPH